MTMRSLRRVRSAAAMADGRGVILNLALHGQDDLEIAMPPEGVATIVQALLSALDDAGKNHQPQTRYQIGAILTEFHQVARDREGGAIVLYLGAGRHCTISFALSPERAAQISDQIGIAAAISSPPDRKSFS